MEKEKPLDGILSHGVVNEGLCDLDDEGNVGEVDEMLDKPELGLEES